jgi:hypothetical protein
MGYNINWSTPNPDRPGAVIVAVFSRNGQHRSTHTLPITESGDVRVTPEMKREFAAAAGVDVTQPYTVIIQPEEADMPQVPSANQVRTIYDLDKVAISIRAAVARREEFHDPNVKFTSADRRGVYIHGGLTGDALVHLQNDLGYNVQVCPKTGSVRVGW